MARVLDGCQGCRPQSLKTHQGGRENRNLEGLSRTHRGGLTLQIWAVFLPLKFAFKPINGAQERTRTSTELPAST